MSSFYRSQVSLPYRQQVPVLSSFYRSQVSVPYRQQVPVLASFYRSPLPSAGTSAVILLQVTLTVSRYQCCHPSTGHRYLYLTVSRYQCCHPSTGHPYRQQVPVLSSFYRSQVSIPYCLSPAHTVSRYPCCHPSTGHRYLYLTACLLPTPSAGIRVVILLQVTGISTLPPLPSLPPPTPTPPSSPVHTVPCPHRQPVPLLSLCSWSQYELHLSPSSLPTASLAEWLRRSRLRRDFSGVESYQ